MTLRLPFLRDDNGSSAWARFLAALAGATILAGCASVAPSARTGPGPSFVVPTPDELRKPVVALVLSGGSARGYAHVGVIKVLEANGLRPDLIVGSSAGSIVGALYASGLSAGELDTAIRQLDISTFSDLALPGLGILPGALGLVRGDRLHRFIDERAKRHRIEDFPIRFAAVATDLATGKAQIFNAGDVGVAVTASSAVPGIIMPARIGGRLYADGQLASPMPVEAARKLGAKIVIAVDVIYPPDDAFLNNAVSMLFQAFTIAVHRVKELEIAGADAIIAPDLGRTSGQWSFKDSDRLIAAGERSAREALSRIRPYFSTKSAGDDSRP